jgi:hypothetical protein
MNHRRSTIFLLRTIRPILIFILASLAVILVVSVVYILFLLVRRTGIWTLGGLGMPRFAVMLVCGLGVSAAFGLIVATLIAYLRLARSLSLPPRFDEKTMHRVAIAIFASLVATAVVGMVWIPSELANDLWDRAENACLQCGYDLTGNQSGRCPECGQDVATE